MAAEILSDSDAFFTFFTSKTRSGTSLVAAGTVTTITFTSALSTTPLVIVSCDQNIELNVGRITNALFDVTSSVAFNNTTVHYHAWE